MGRPRALVVDDSVVVRRLVSKALEEDGSIEVAGVAADGRIALAKIPHLNPDVVILDVEMPVMDGLAALAEIREKWPKLPVIMFSTLTARGAAVTLDALALGASDYVAKPGNAGDPAKNVARIREELVPRVFALCPAVAGGRRLEGIRPAEGSRSASTLLPPRGGPPTRVDIVAIGVSTGGPNALGELLPRLPSALPVPIVIVQHMPPMFTKILAERLDAKAALRVVEGTDGDVLEPGGVWIAPGGKHMAVDRAGRTSRIRTYTGRFENSCRPSVDPLFRSVADAFGENALGIVLTGMGNDGSRGAEYMCAAGGKVIVQDEASSVVWGMPGFVARAGLADAVVPMRNMAREIVNRVDIARHSIRVVEGVMS